MRELTGEQKGRLQAAVSGNTFTRDQLRQMLLVRLNRNLDTIADPNANLDAAWLDVIERAQGEGWMADLLRAVGAERPQRPDVQNLVRELLAWVESDEAPPPKPSGQAGNDAGGRMSNDRDRSQKPPAQTSDKQPTYFKLGPFEFKGPIPVLFALFVGFVVAYPFILEVVIPKRVPYVSPMFIQAVMTAQPTPTPTPTPTPRLHLVARDKILQDKQICVEPGESVVVEIEPRPAHGCDEYLWSAYGAGVDLKVGYCRADVKFSEGSLARILVSVCKTDPDTGTCDDRIGKMDINFVAQEVCPR